MRDFVARFGCPLEIHTNQGRNFESELFKEMCELLEIGKTRTTSCRPSANGQVERYNRSIAQIIRCCIGDRQERWDDFVGIAVGAIRATVNRSTPHRSREVMMPLDLMLGSDGEEAKGGGVLLGPILRMAGWRHIEKQGKYLKGSKGDRKSIMICEREPQFTK